MRTRTATLALALLAVTTVAMAVAIWMVFLYAPDERVMGAVQRIFYFHVPSAIVTFLSTYPILVYSARAASLCPNTCKKIWSMPQC